MNQLILTVLLILSGAMQLTEAAECDSNPCKNGGTCTIPDEGYNWGYTCKCRPGFVGCQCQWDNDTCDPNTVTPCQNGGSCVVNGDGRFCICPNATETGISYGGHYCEIVNPCESCPDNTKYCIAAATKPNGRLCLDQGHKEIMKPA